MTLEHGRPDNPRPEAQWPDEDWPDDSDWPEAGPVPISAGQGAGDRGRRWPRFLIVAVVALAAGAAGTLAVRDITAGSSPAPVQSGTGQPSISQPGSGQGGSLGPGQQAGQPPPGASATLVLAGRVRAVSATSITIAAGPQSVTAAVTGSTRFSGQATRIGQVRAGDLVMAQIAERNGVASVVTLQDPASPS